MKLKLFILFTLILTACRTTSETLNRDSDTNRKMLERLEFHKQTNSSVLDSLLSHYKATIKKTERFYAPPDSIGNQPIISETQYDIELEGDETAISNKKSENKTDLNNDKKKDDIRKQIEYQDKKTDRRIFKPPQWMIATFFIILVIGIIYKCRKIIVHD
ncbi:hypothetical protein [Parabacteroides goldsteinii]|uniref:hypothetical protein n=1 Tax=Parabacteroides goldsteinii TaxID=328812 RepID=UPI0032190AD7